MRSASGHSTIHPTRLTQPTTASAAAARTGPPAPGRRMRAKDSAKAPFRRGAVDMAQRVANIQK